MPHRSRITDDVVLRSVIDAAPDCFVVTDERGRIVLVNAEVERLFGYDRKELLDQSIEILVPERYREAHRGHRAGFMSAPQLRPMGAGQKLYGLKKDGGEFPVEISLSPVASEGGVLVCCVVRDITDRKRTEERFRTLLDSAPDAMVVAGTDGRIALVNTQTEKLFGYDRHELIGQPVEILVPERLRTSHRKHREHYAAHPQIRPMGAGLELHGVRKNGTEFPVEISLSPQTLADGTLITSTVRDITERRKIESALRQSEANFRAMVEGTYGVYRAGADGTILMVNEALVKMLGYESQADLRTVNLATDIFQQGEYPTTLFEPHGRRGQFVRVEAKWRCKQGRAIVVELSGRPIEGEAGELMYYEVLVEDVSHHRIVEHRLRHVQKMEEIGRLAGGIAHDFNNVLGVVSGYAEMLAEALADRSDLLDMVGKLQRGAERGATLTRQLLAFSRQQVLQLKVIDVNDHVRSVETLLRRVTREDIRLSVITGASPLKVKADLAQLEQVIVNLVVNARDSMPGGGSLVIEVSETFIDREYCTRNPEAHSGRHAVIAVTDTGCGMTREVMSHLFEPFFTTKERGKGTGLGLATVYGIVKQSGGHMTVYSEAGRGSTFKVALPCTQEPHEQIESESQEPSVTTGTETILLVEDEEDLRTVITGYLKGKGYVVLPASTPTEALQLGEDTSRTIQLLLTDVVLPEMDGVKLAGLLRRQRPDLRTLYISGYAADAIFPQGTQREDFGFLSKPFSLTDLGQKIRTVCGQPTVERVG
jgi:hypothetical protein